MDGRTIRGTVKQSNGGVGRNLADAIGRLLDVPPVFISAVGDDALGKKLLSDLPHVNTEVVIKSDKNTAHANVLLDKSGECVIIVADMEIHQDILPHEISNFEDFIGSTNFVVFDGNLSIKSMNSLLQMSRKYNIPVWFEPTDITTAAKPFLTQLWRNIKYISPNLNELLEMSKVLNKGKHLNFEAISFSEKDIIHQAVEHALPLSQFLATIIVTLGSHGVVVLTHAESDSSNDVVIRHYKSPSISKVVNVSGAGDCLAAGIIAGLVRGHSESEAMAVGLNAASLALQSESTVCKSLKWINPVKGAKFKTLKLNDFSFN